MSSSNNTLKPKRRTLGGFLKSFRRSRPSPALSRVPSELDRTTSPSHVGTDEASESASVVNSEGPHVNIPVASNQEATPPRPSGEMARVPVISIILPPDTEGGSTELAPDHEELPTAGDLPGQDIPNNDTLEADPELERQNALWAELRTSLGALKDNSNIVPDLVAPIEVLLSCLDGLKSISRNQSDCEDLTKRLTVLSETLRQREGRMSTIPISDALLSVILSINHEAHGIKAMLERGTEGTEYISANEEELVQRYGRIEALFQQLQASLEVEGNDVLTIGIQVNAKWAGRHIPDESLMNTRLDRLSPAKQAFYDSSLSQELDRRSCTEGTRVSVLAEVDEWLKDPTSPSVYWIDGTVGTGKTAIAYTLCERMKKRKWLAASFFCTAESEDCEDVSRIIPTIAYQLAGYSAPFRSALFDLLGQNPEIASRTLQKQFEKLLLEPTKHAKDTLPDRLVAVIDALDECASRNGAEEILKLLFDHAPDVPLKFIVTSRPETEIYTRMSLNAKSRRAIHLNDIDRSRVQADMKLYLTRELEFLSPTEADINQLAERSGASFIYAANLVRYARSEGRRADLRERLRSLIDMSPEEEHKLVDPLYMKIVKNALTDDDLEADETEDIRVVLNTVLLAQEPINIETIAMLGGINGLQRVENALHPLRSAVHYSEKTGLVSTLDSAFPEIMFNEERSGSYFCDVSKHSLLLAQGCFLGMKEHLRFNICELETSFSPDDKLNNIQSRINDRIPPTLAYACRYWANHLSLAANVDGILAMLCEFLSERLLFWMEVLNLRKELDMGVAALSKAKQRLEGASSPELVSFLDDAYHFARDFAASPVSQSTPHIYISSLQLCSRSSLVYQTYSSSVKHLLKPQGNPAAHHTSDLLASQTWKVGSGVLSIAYSPDGTLAAAGCEDGTIIVFNVHDGSRLPGPLKGHAGWVRCVAFSPDSTRLISSSSDHTIKMWNPREGTPINISFKGHDYPVWSVAFSPDGNRIVSGSWDCTVRVWNAADGRLVRDPMEGHKWGVNCVAFSPDGSFVASGANDHTIRLWDLADDTRDAEELKGHTNSVMSIAFTPDSTRLVSGSVDCTIRIWSLDGALLKTFLQGCAHFIYALAISPDGSSIASASADSVIQVWDINNGNLIAGPFIVHSCGVRAVAFSPDGTQLLSRFLHDSVRFWNLKAPPTSTSTSTSTFRNQVHNGVLAQVTPSRVRNRPGTSNIIPSDYYSRRVRAWYQEKQTSHSSRSRPQAATAAFAWLLDSSGLGYLPKDATTSDDESTSVESSDGISNIPKGWSRRQDGWLLNNRSQLVVWLPPSSTACHLLSHTTNNSELLFTLLQKECFVGNRWPRSIKAKPV